MPLPGHSSRRVTAGIMLVGLALGPRAVCHGQNVDPARLKSISAEQAADIVKQGKPLTLAVTELSPEVAAVLAGTKAEVRFAALTQMTAEAAAALAKHEGVLALPTLTDLTAPVAAALATHPGDLALPAVTTIAPEVAAALAPHPGTLFLGVRDLSD